MYYRSLNTPFIFLVVCFFYLIYPFIMMAQDDSFDWEYYPIWENTTKYSKIYVVNQKHKKASDTNPGTEKEPLRTVSAATRLVKPGEKVLIHKGIYREMIEPVRGGTAPDKMISFEAATGEEVIISGSRIIGSNWVKEIKVDKKSIPPSVTISRSKKLWMTTLDDTLFNNGYYPFKLLNAEEKEYTGLQLTQPVKYNSPLTLTRGMIFQNGQRMAQLNHYGDLIHVPGSFWVDTDKKTIHIHPFENKDPNEDKFEIVVQCYLMKPKDIGLNYIQVKGLVFEHCANGFLGTGNGAVSTMGGHHWIFENNLIREINSSGLEFGTKVNKDKDNKLTQDTVLQDTILKSLSDENGYINVSNNIIYACGTAGIKSNGIKHAIIKNNEIMYCGWQEADHYQECAGIKLLESDHCLVSNNLVHHVMGAGIWLQWGNKHSRITRNIIHNISTFQGALLIEASRIENLIDNNFIWYIDGIGINGNYSDNQLYYHNLIAYTNESIVKITAPEKIELDSIKLTAKKNHISNNIFIDFGERMKLSSPSNVVNNNIFVFSTKLGNLELKKWQERIISKSGLIMRADVDFNPNTLVFKWNSNQEVLPVPSLTEVKTDFTNEKRNSTTTLPGPFRTLLPNCDYYVSMKVR